MGWVADNQPRVFLTYEDGRLYDYADGPSLGVLNFWDAVEFDAAGNGSVDAAVLTQETERFLTEAQLSEYGFEVGGEFLSEELCITSLPIPNSDCFGACRFGQTAE